MPEPKKNIPETKIIYKILRFYYIDNMTQQEIANKMNLSRMRVLRYLDLAKKSKLIEFKLNIPNKDSYELERLVEEKFSIVECDIVPTFDNINEIYKYAGLELSYLLKRILKKDVYIGISWSRDAKGVLDFVNIEKKFPVNVVPIIGGLQIDENINNSNYISNRFAEKFGGSSFAINIPAVFDKKETKALVENESGTKKIKDLVKKIDISITGIGNIGVQSTAYNSGFFTLEEMNYLNTLGICGIVNLNFMDENGREVITDLDSRVIKIYSLERFRKTRISIGIAFGKSKSNALKAALSGGIINYLITDEDTARALFIE